MTYFTPKRRKRKRITKGRSQNRLRGVNEPRRLRKHRRH